jgi:hypothetical protein
LARAFQTRHAHTHLAAGGGRQEELGVGGALQEEAADGVGGAVVEVEKRQGAANLCERWRERAPKNNKEAIGRARKRDCESEN